jgi:tetratricopeptide (TPR) repeat protein
MGFAVAEDPSGDTARTWMDATQSTGLPTAMIVDRSLKLVWFRHTRDLAKPLKQVVEGDFDVSRGLTEMNLRIRVGRLANESAKAIEKGEYQEGIRLILEALEADPDTVAEWIPSTYGHLLATSQSPAIAAGLARSVLATGAGKRKELVAGLTNAILHFRPKELRDLDLALSLARRADAMSDGRDAGILSMLAMLRAELGDRAGAIQELEAAMPNAANQDARELLSKTLKDLQEPAGH